MTWHYQNDSDSLIKGGGAADVLRSNVILDAWLTVRNVAKLVPSTLIPIGVLILLYNMYVQKNPAAGAASKHQKGGSMIHQHPLVEEWSTITNSHQDVKPSLLVPFALVLGRDILKATLNKRNT